MGACAAVANIKGFSAGNSKNKMATAIVGQVIFAFDVPLPDTSKFLMLPGNTW